MGDVLKLSDKDVRRRVLQIFADCRQAPEAQFDENWFLDHLVEPPAKNRQIRDSFSSTRRYVRFIDAVQSEFAVYFSKKDWDTEFSLGRFVQRIQELRNNPTGSIRSLKNARSSYDINVVIVSNLLVLVSGWFSRHIPWLFTIFLAVWILMNCWIFWFYRREKKYFDGLETKILRLQTEKRLSR